MYCLPILYVFSTCTVILGHFIGICIFRYSGLCLGMLGYSRLCLDHFIGISQYNRLCVWTMLYAFSGMADCLERFLGIFSYISLCLKHFQVQQTQPGPLYRHFQVVVNCEWTMLGIFRSRIVLQNFSFYIKRRFNCQLDKSTFLTYFWIGRFHHSQPNRVLDWESFCSDFISPSLILFHSFWMLLFFFFFVTSKQVVNEDSSLSNYTSSVIIQHLYLLLVLVTPTPNNRLLLGGTVRNRQNGWKRKIIWLNWQMIMTNSLFYN